MSSSLKLLQLARELADCANFSDCLPIWSLALAWDLTVYIYIIYWFRISLMRWNNVHHLTYGYALNSYVYMTIQKYYLSYNISKVFCFLIKQKKEINFLKYEVQLSLKILNKFV